MITFRNLNEKLIIFGLFLTPFLNLFEIADRISTGGTFIFNLDAFLTPFWIKLIKDILFLLVLINSFFILFYKRKAQKIFISFAIIFVIILMSFLSTLVDNSFLVGVAGIRWILPLFLVFFFINQFDEIFIEKIINKLVFLLILHLIFQVIQSILYASFGVYGILGVEARVGGMFYSPNAGGLFSCLIFFYLTNYNYNSKYLRFYKILCILSVLLSASATCIMILITLITINFSYKYHLKKVLFLIAPVMFFIALLNLETISGRGGLVKGSLGVRSEHFLSAVEQVSLISTNFGSATSSAFMLREMGFKLKTIPADSVITAIIFNFGIWGFVILFYIFGYPIFYSIINDDKKGISLSLLLLLASATMMVFEIYPVNLLLAVTFSIIIKDYDSINYKSLYKIS